MSRARKFGMEYNLEVLQVDGGTVRALLCHDDHVTW